MPAGRTIPFKSSVKIDNERNLEMQADLAAETAEVVNLVDGKPWTGGGGGDFGTLVYDENITLNYDSTSEGVVANLDIPYDRQKIYYCVIIDTAGKRNGYFYRSDTLPIGSNYSRRIIRTNENNQLSGTTSTLGIFFNVANEKFNISAKYSATSSGIINGVYNAKIYVIEP